MGPPRERDGETKRRLRLGDAGRQLVADECLVEVFVHGADYPSCRYGLVRVPCLIHGARGA